MIKSLLRMASKSKFTVDQINLVKRFATLNNDWVSVAPNATNFDVIKTLSQQLDVVEDTEVQRRYKERYADKLRKKAEEEGFTTVEEMMEAKLKKEKENKKPTPENKPKKNLGKKSDTLPSFAKKLEDVLKIDLIQDKTPEEISKIWNLYHASKDCVSAAIPADFYQKLYARGKQFPMVR
jgi:negative regulator of genetic competence, sporulation and motility